MELDLIRYRITEKSITGKLSIDGIYECYTLERPYNDPEIKPIPEGKYAVNIRWSPHFKQDMPHIDGVSGREAIEIHWGNEPANTHGCVLVGIEDGIDEILFSKIAFNDLFEKLKRHKDPIFITVQESASEKNT